MRLSEAILAGSTVVKADRGALLWSWHDGKRGCALGMACEAMALEVDPKQQQSLKPIYKEWPWTEHRMIWNNKVCCCKLLGRRNVAQFIAHLFDFHVCAENPLEPIWTLQQLVDFIRRIEPPEPVSTQTEGRDPVCSQTAEMECRK